MEKRILWDNGIKACLQSFTKEHMEDFLELLDYIQDHSIEDVICENTREDASLWEWLYTKDKVELNDIKRELSRNLVLSAEKNSYQEAAKRFSMDMGIECSTQAGREKVQGLKETCFNTEKGQKETVICELHTKFKRFNIDRDKQDRIYFFPGKKGVMGGKVIIKHIGGHL